jgi:D-sedoheptulose 7-phosphate isomerase
VAAVEAMFDEHAVPVAATRAQLSLAIAQLASQISDAVESGGKVLVFGNGGSAADAQHLAAELVGRFQRARPGLAAVALTTDSSVLTAIANDFSYDAVFARQVEALCQPRDIVIGINTSGRAASVARGLTAARESGARTWALCGRDGRSVADTAEQVLRVPSDSTARIQEMHELIIHAVSELVDQRAAEADRATSSTG